MEILWRNIKKKFSKVQRSLALVITWFPLRCTINDENIENSDNNDNNEINSETDETESIDDLINQIAYNKN